MVRSLILLGVGLLSVVGVQAQQQNSVRAKAAEAQAIGITDAALIDQFLLTIPGVAAGSRSAIDQQSLKPYFMPVRRAGFRGSDWSYSLAACLEFYVNLNRNFKDNLSPDYIALSLQAQGQRPTLSQGLRFLSTTGTVSAAIVPYDAGAIPTAVYATQPYRIANFLHIFRDVTKGREKTFEVRKALTRGNPVVVELLTDASFPSISQTDTWQPTGATTESRTLVIVGFDETRGAFELQSAYGSAWGNSGYLWVKYADFERAAVNGYAMVPQQY